MKHECNGKIIFVDVKYVKPAFTKKVVLLKTGNTDEDIGDFAGTANGEVRKGKAEEHWLAVQKPFYSSYS